MSHQEAVPAGIAVPRPENELRGLLSVLNAPGNPDSVASPGILNT